MEFMECVRFVLSGVKFVGLVKYLLNELAISLLVVEVMLLFVFGEWLVYFLVEGLEVWMGWGCAA